MVRVADIVLMVLTVVVLASAHRWSEGVEPLPHVELEIVAGREAVPTAASDWVRTVGGISGVRVRATSRDAQPDLQREGGVIQIVGVIGRGNELIVPGKRFRLGQRKALQDWITQIRQGSDDEKETDRFGLPAEILLQVQKGLQIPAAEKTASISAEVVLRRLSEQVEFPLGISSDVAQLLKHHRVDNELEGVSVGTALAAILYPLDLGFVPVLSRSNQGAPGRTSKPSPRSERDSALVELRIVSKQKDLEVWPVGWKPEQPQNEVVPKLFESLEIDVRETAIEELLDALQPRLKIPFLVDHPGLEIADVDLSRMKVTLPAKRMMYFKVLDVALFKAHLEHELRVDERGEPFLWIQPLTVRAAE